MIPLAFIHSANLALVLAVPIGLMGGIATAAYLRSGHEVLSAGLAGNLDDAGGRRIRAVYPWWRPVGLRIYNSSPTHGFLYCVIATTAVYALILPLILLVPKELIATADGEPNPKVEAEMLEEIAATS